ncbi:MAG: molybdate ABC transporter permease subunit [Gemmatimonadetes bacterium]|jgi:molybdate transport system permease protein|nr:molybdate ABC transporter permease subunit [Gemmatimonadota bacterium]MBT7862050.1 molybdate ABC transporter permease subunit [Gemmatimonadota bacterium]
MIGPPFWLSVQVTATAAVLIFTIGTALALWLVRRNPRGRTVIETLIMLPLVLPPSVVGYYLLIVLGQHGPLVQWLGIQTLFTPVAAIIAATVVGLPLMVQAARASLAAVDPALEQAARTLGCSELMVLWRITLPLARRGLLAGLVLGATRALGEFGATLMVAGNIPGRTQTLPLAIYDAVQTNQHELTTQMVLLMTGLGFVSLWAVRHWEPIGRRRG